MRLGLLEQGRGYRMDDASLDVGQRATLADMARFGLCYRPSDNKAVYYATPLAQYLLAGQTAASAVGAMASTASAAVAEADASGGAIGAVGGGGAHSSSSAKPSSGAALTSQAAVGGFVVVETNFRMYAYTKSPLWGHVLSLFARIEYALPNLLVCALTRESIHKALNAGISASEVQAFLERNAHARMLQRQSEHGGPVMPETVVHQLQLWARERHRLQMHRARVYEGFLSAAEFAAAEAYARDSGVHLWARRAPEPHRCALAVNAAAHGEMKKFIRSWRAEQPAGPTG